MYNKSMISKNGFSTGIVAILISIILFLIFILFVKGPKIISDKSNMDNVNISELKPQEIVEEKWTDKCINDVEWKTYRNSIFGIEFELPTYYDVISESDESIMLGYGITEEDDKFAYLRIYKDIKTDPSIITTICEEIENIYDEGRYEENFPCLNSTTWEELEHLNFTVEGKKTRDFVITEGLESSWHYLQVLEEPEIEFRITGKSKCTDVLYEIMIQSLKFTD